MRINKKEAITIRIIDTKTFQGKVNGDSGIEDVSILIAAETRTPLKKQNDPSDNLNILKNPFLKLFIDIFFKTDYLTLLSSSLKIFLYFSINIFISNVLISNKKLSTSSKSVSIILFASSTFTHFNMLSIHSFFIE